MGETLGPVLLILTRLLFRLVGTAMTVGIPVWEPLLVVIRGHCSETGLPAGKEFSSFSGVVLGVTSLGSSAISPDGEASVVLVPDRSVIADKGERGIARSGTALWIFFCLLVLGMEKERAEKEARKLRRRFCWDDASPSPSAW